jgi:hypothetical protein
MPGGTGQERRAEQAKKRWPDVAHAQHRTPEQGGEGQRCRDGREGRGHWPGGRHDLSMPERD